MFETVLYRSSPDRINLKDLPPQTKKMIKGLLKYYACLSFVKLYVNNVFKHIVSNVMQIWLLWLWTVIREGNCSMHFFLVYFILLFSADRSVMEKLICIFFTAKWA